MNTTSKVFKDLSIDTGGLARIEAVAAEIFQLQAALREAVLNEIAQIEQEGKLTVTERRIIQSALISDLGNTGADLTI